MIDTSGAIVGRHERGETTQSIEVAKKLAEAFGVTLDSPVSQQEPSALVQNTSMLERIRAIGELPPDERDEPPYGVEWLLGDARARRAYAAA